MWRPIRAEFENRHLRSDLLVIGPSTSSLHLIVLDNPKKGVSFASK
jgi:hypothetical protein